MEFQKESNPDNNNQDSASSLNTPPPPTSITAASLARMIDHTLLKPEATIDDVRRVCQEALKFQFATVCVNSTHIQAVADLLQGSSTKPIAVIDFPLGAASSASKVFETREAIRCGAQEIDMVISIGALKDHNYSYVLDDIRQVVEAAQTGPTPVIVKVILETSNLTLEEKIIGCALSKAAGAHFVKTSTGFSTGGATVEDVTLMRKVVGPKIGVKASGGIRTYEDALKMIAAGANRLGTSAGVAIITQAQGLPASNVKSSSPSSY